MRLFVSLLIIAALFSAGCGTPAPRKIMNEGVFGEASPSAVFKECVKALHVQGYITQAISFDAGVISTDWQSFDIPKFDGKVSGKYKMNILVFRNKNSKTSLSVKIKAAWDSTDEEIPDAKISPWVNNEVGVRVKKLFEEIGKLVGNPEFTSSFTLTTE